MLRIKFTYLDLINANNPLNGIYYFASESLDYDNIYWDSRIVEPFEIERFFEIESDTANRIRTVSVQLDNHDKYFNRFISDTTTLLNNQMTLYYDDGNGVTKSFTGKIQSIDSFGSTVSVTVRELGYEYLENTFPDAQIAYDYYSASGINESWNCIPIHFGTVKRIPVSWVNSFFSEYMIGSGPILSVDKVYIDDEVIYDVADPDIHYKYDDNAKEIHVRIFKGRGYDADGQREYIDDEYHYENETPVSGNLYRHTSNWGGFAYIQLFSIDDDGFEIPAYPYNKDGGIGQVYVDIRGIVDVIPVPGGYDYGTSMVRNPAKIIKMMFCNPELVDEGPCAIGWGYSEEHCDFSQAIQDCEDLGFVIDGSFDSAGQFSEALKQILYCCRGYVIEENEKITLHIDKARDGNDVPQFDEEGLYGHNCTLESWSEDDVDNHINRVRLNYDWSQEFNRYMKKPDANHESPDTTDTEDYDKYLQDLNDTLKVQKWNPEELEFKMVSDVTTAHRLAIYYLRKKSRQHIKSSLTCPNSAAMDLDAGDIIRVRSNQFNWYAYDKYTQTYDTSVGKLFQITKISKGQDITTIEFCEYDDSIFEHDYTDFTSASRADGVDSKLSAKTPLNVVITASYKEVAQSYVCELNGKITFDSTGHKQYSIVKYCDCGTNPPSGSYEYNWITYANIDGDEFTINGLNAGHYYTVAVSTRNNYDVSAPFITGALLIPGDNIAPDVPVAVVSVYLKTVNFDISIPNYPSDLCGFAVYRTNDPNKDVSEYTQIGVCYANNGIGTFTDDTVPSYDIPYYYTIRAFDCWGNYSDYVTPPYEAVCPKIQVADVTHDWIVSNIFETAINVGPTTNGVRFTSNGIQGWYDGTNLFNLNATGISTIAGWKIDYNRLTNDRIEINSDGMLRTTDFVSGHNGWTINNEGDAEFNNVKVRGIVNTAVFEKDRISAVGGYELIRPATISTTTGSGEFVDFTYLVSESNFSVDEVTTQHTYVMEDLNALMDADETLASYEDDMTYDEYMDIEYEAAELAAELMGYILNDDGKKVFVADNSEFKVNDIVRIKNGVTNDVWARVSSKGSTVYRGNYLNLETTSGIWFEPEAGQSIVNYGNGDDDKGGILFDGKSPLIDLYTHDGEPWNGVDTYIRLGNLNGINGIYTDRHGFFVGNADLSDENRSYIQYDEESKQLKVRAIVDIIGGQAKSDIDNAVNIANSAVNTASSASANAQNALAMANGMIKKADVYYSLSDSNKTNTGQWQTETPQWQPNKYIWTKTVYTLADGVSKTESSAVCISGAKGPAGESGITVVNLTELYYCSNSAIPPVAPESDEGPIIETRDVYNTWTQNCPTWTETYKYYYTCIEIKYSDDTYTYSVTANQKGIQNANEQSGLAKRNADSALSTLSDYSSDSKIVPPEKEGLRQMINDIQSEYYQIHNQAQILTVEDADYTRAYNRVMIALKYFCGIATEEEPNPPSWNTTIDISKGIAQIYYGYITDYYTTRVNIENSIVWRTKQISDENKSYGINAYNVAVSHYGTCDTASSIRNKVVTMVNSGDGEFPPVLWIGATIKVRFANANTALSTVTMDVNNTGPKPITVSGETFRGGSDYIYNWRANDVVDFIYTGTSWALLNLPAIGSIFYQGKTTINGGLLQTGTVQATAIVAHSITTNELASDAIKSINYVESTIDDFSLSGTFINMLNGTFTSKMFRIDENGNAYFKGNITGASGTFSGTLNATRGNIGEFVIENGFLNCSSNLISPTSAAIKLENNNIPVTNGNESINTSLTIGGMQTVINTKWQERHTFNFGIDLNDYTAGKAGAEYYFGKTYENFGTSKKITARFDEKSLRFEEYDTRTSKRMAYTRLINNQGFEIKNDDYYFGCGPNGIEYNPTPTATMPDPNRFYINNNSLQVGNNSGMFRVGQRDYNSKNLTVECLNMSNMHLSNFFSSNSFRSFDIDLKEPDTYYVDNGVVTIGCKEQDTALDTIGNISCRSIRLLRDSYINNYKILTQSDLYMGYIPAESHYQYYEKDVADEYYEFKTGIKIDQNRWSYPFKITTGSMKSTVDYQTLTFNFQPFNTTNSFHVILVPQVSRETWVNLTEKTETHIKFQVRHSGVTVKIILIGTAYM